MDTGRATCWACLLMPPMGFSEKGEVATTSEDSARDINKVAEASDLGRFADWIHLHPDAVKHCGSATRMCSEPDILRLPGVDKK